VNLEKLVAERVCELAAGKPVDALLDDSSFPDLLSALEYYLPQTLSEIHQEWDHESLDGIYPNVVRKTAERRIEIVGWCILISDQTMTPLELELEVSPAADEVIWLDCRLGRLGPNGMIRIPYGRRPDIRNDYQWKSKNWAYHVGFDHRMENAGDG
jgi:hypothetical protein